MGYLHGTPNFDLPQTVGTDVRDWFDTNDAFAKVDKSLQDVIDESADNVRRLDEDELTITNHNTRITTLEGDMEVAKNDIDTLEANVATLVSDTADQFQDVKDAIDPDEEKTAIASHEYKVGERFWYNDTWYKCTVDIAEGATIVPNVNCTSINVDSELTALYGNASNVDGEITNINTAISNTNTNIGDLSNLATTDKDSIVEAINELNSAIASANTLIGTLSSLRTDVKSSLVGAINEVDTHTDTNTTAIGTLSSLQTTSKTNLVSAINEVLGKVGTMGIRHVQAFRQYDSHGAGAYSFDVTIPLSGFTDASKMFVASFRSKGNIDINGTPTLTTTALTLPCYQSITDKSQSTDFLGWVVETY